jgi:hypothetical protein
MAAPYPEEEQADEIGLAAASRSQRRARRSSKREKDEEQLSDDISGEYLM